MLRKIWNGESKTITSAALLLGAASLASKFLGMFRDRALAGVFGAGDTLDAYYAAFRLPDMLYGLLILGALSAGFIPIFTEYLMRDKEGAEEDAWRLTNELLGILGIALVALTSIFIVFAPKIVPAITPGFHGAKLDLTIHLSQIMFVSTLLLGFSAVLGGVLQGTKRFFAFAVAPIFYNIGIIIGALVFVRFWGAYGLAAGVVLGAVLHFVSQYLPATGLGFKFRPCFKTSDGGVAKIARQSAPRILSLAVTQVDFTVATFIATTLASGSVSVINLANNLQMVPVGLIGISYAVAAYPSLTRLAVKNENGKFVENLSGAIRQVLFLVVPISILLLLLRAQVVRVILGSGHFDWNDTTRTADALALFAISIAAQSVAPILVRAFYALKDSTTPLLIGMVAVAADIIGNLTLSKTLGVAGLALSFSIAAAIQVSLLWVMLRLKTGTLEEASVLRTLAKITASSLAMAIVVQLVKGFIGPIVSMNTFIGVFIQLVVAGTAGVGAYFGIAHLLRSEEMAGFIISVKRRVGINDLPVIAAEETV